MGRRASQLGSVSSKRRVGRKVPLESLDDHEGLSINQVKIILRAFGLLDKYDEFSKWMYGQTCPIIKRGGEYDVWHSVGGIYEYDLFRWIESKTSGRAPLWD